MVLRELFQEGLHRIWHIPWFYIPQQGLGGQEIVDIHQRAELSWEFSG